MIMNILKYPVCLLKNHANGFIKITVAGLLLAFLSLSIGLLWSSKADCWQCKKDPCYYDIQCGTWCHCHKAENEMRGVCISE